MPPSTQEPKVQAQSEDELRKKLNSKKRKLGRRKSTAKPDKYGPDEPDQPPRDPQPWDRYGRPWAVDQNGVPFALNEKYWAVRFTLETGVIYNQIEKKYFIYSNDCIWKPCETGQVADLVDEFVRNSDVDFREVQIERILRRKTTEEVAKLIASLDGAVNNFFFEEAPRGVIYVKNGRLELSSTGKFKFTSERGRREDRQRYRLNIAYDRKAKPKRLLAWLNRIFSGRQDDVEAVQNFLGGCLFGRNDWKKMLVIFGEANLGKGKIGDVGAELCGIYRRVAFKTSKFNDRFNSYSLVGKTLMQAGDARADFLATQCADFLKEVVGGDPISAEQKFTHNDPDLRGIKHVIIASNFSLQVRPGIDRSAWIERLVYLHADGAPYEQGERDRNLVENLFRDPQEASGILLFALLGLKRILAKDWIHSPAQKARVIGIMERSDSVGKFVADSTQVTPGKSATTEELFGAYHRWCKHRGWTPWPKSEFEKMIEEAMVAVWGISKSNDLERFDKIQRGFHRIEILLPGENMASETVYDIKAAA
jgi:phage/plasmid-associated DNA primase